jgi:hypothetical protein
MCRIPTIRQNVVRVLGASTGGTVTPFPKPRSGADLAAAVRRPAEWPRLINATLSQPGEVICDGAGTSVLLAELAGRRFCQTVACLEPGPDGKVEVHVAGGWLGILHDDDVGAIWTDLSEAITAWGYCAVVVDLFDGGFPRAVVSGDPQ